MSMAQRVFLLIVIFHKHSNDPCAFACIKTLSVKVCKTLTIVGVFLFPTDNTIFT